MQTYGIQYLTTRDCRFLDAFLGVILNLYVNCSYWPTRREMTGMDVSRTMKTLLLLFCLLQSTKAGTSNDFPYSSCKQIKQASSSAPSGEYSIRTSTGRVLEKVYCEMGLNGGGYTFLHPSDITDLTQAELSAMFTDKTNFLLRFRMTNGMQPYGVLKQLPQYSNNLLSLTLSSNIGYNTPQNVPFLGLPYLYYGFLPTTLAGGVGSTHGLQVNDVSITFVNCDGNTNSYFALFPDFTESAPTTYAFSTSFPMYNSIIAALKQNPSRRVIPDDYFMFFETHFGDCGLYTQADARQKTIISAVIGFR